MNYSELKPLFAVLLNLMTNQSYAQVTIACKTVESPILQSPPKCDMFQLSQRKFDKFILGLTRKNYSTASKEEEQFG